jgi:DNA-binding CsgD family transcriptional regulator
VRAVARLQLPCRLPTRSQKPASPLPLAQLVCRRSRSRRLRRLVRDLPLSTSKHFLRAGGHEPRERLSEERAGAGTQRHGRTDRPRRTNQPSEEGEALAPTTWNREEGKRRRDSGSFQVSERDLELLLLIAEQYAITLDQLARLIGRTYRTARGLRDRWCNAGWTQSAKLAVELPPFVWLTSPGNRVIDSPYRTWNAHPGLATHIEAVTDVRLLLERELRIGEWECERSLAQRSPPRSENRPHLPDAVLTCPKRIAVEVELHLKSRTRLETIIEELSLNYDSVWYFAPDRLRPKLTELAQSASYGNVTIHRYPPNAADWQRRQALPWH